MRGWHVVAIVTATSVFPGVSGANQRRFGYSYETATLPPGVAELEIWSTGRVGHETRYTRLDERLELEVGLSDRLQTAFYLNFSSVAEAQAIEGTDTIVSTFDFEGVSSEWKYKLTDPVADFLGSALYGEARFAPTEMELEAKILLDRRLGRFLLAGNVIGEYEWKFPAGETVQEQGLEITAGAAYFLVPELSLGLEARVPTIFEHEEGKDITLSALYAGPVIAYARDRWWATLSVMPQLTALATEEPGESLELHENEKVDVRLLFSFQI